MGQLVFQATAGGQVALVGPNPATNFSLNVPAVNGNLVTTGDTGTVTNTMLASSAYTAPGTIGSGTPNTGAFTSLSASTSITNSSLTAGRVVYTGTGGLESASANLTFNGTTLTVANDASISGLTVGKGGGNNANNTVVGYQAANSNSASSIEAFGYQALYANTSGANNSAFGFYALQQNTTGSGNNAFGRGALAANTTGSNNTAFGYPALNANTTGGSNTAVGTSALASNTTASNNTAVGYQAGYSNTTGNSNAYLGYQAGYLNNASQNAFVGYQAGYNSTCNYATAIGYQAGYNNTDGTYGNVFVGWGSGKANTSGAPNTAIGSSSLSANTTGGLNVAVGYNALQSNTTASNNTAVGYSASYSNTTGASNTTVGYNALYSGTTAASAIAIGVSSANALTTGSNGIYIGAASTASSGSVNSEIVIATNGPSGKGANTGLINPNNGGVYQGNNSTLWSITSDQRLKKNIVDNNDGLDKITQIKVRNFEYRTANEVTELPKENAINIAGVQLGAIAQELIEVLPDCVKIESTGVMSVDASNITWHLVNAIKELNAKVTALEAKLGA